MGFSFQKLAAIGGYSAMWAVNFLLRKNKATEKKHFVVRYTATLTQEKSLNILIKIQEYIIDWVWTTERTENE